MFIQLQLGKAFASVFGGFEEVKELKPEMKKPAQAFRKLENSIQRKVKETAVEYDKNAIEGQLLPKFVKRGLHLMRLVDSKGVGTLIVLRGVCKDEV